MADNILGTIPDFTSDETVDPVAPQIPEEVKTEEESSDETETPSLPEETPDESIVEEPLAPEEDTAKAIQGLQNERVKLLREISDLKGTKREIKQDRLTEVQTQIDELKDLNPDDVAIIDKVLRAKGYMTKPEADKMFYEAVKTEETNKFLDKYPEYKPENDPGDVNWTMLQREIEYYKAPTNPRQIADILDRAHRAVVKVPSGTSNAPQRRQVQLASVGGGGTQPSSSPAKLDPEKRAMLKGFSDEDIKAMESKL